MAKKINPKKFRILFGLILLVVVLSLVVIKGLLPKNTKAAWFDDAWAYRQSITITVQSNASDVTNSQILIYVNTSALISTKLQSSCQDLRFTDTNGNLLPYYIAGGCNTTTTKIWVLIELVPKNSTTYTLYMYYGNPTAIAGGDTSATPNFNMANGLVGYWPMNEASWTNNCSAGTVLDSSTNSNNLKSCPNATGPTGGATGRYGKAGDFDGSDDELEVGDTSTLEPVSDMTVSAWVKFDTMATVKGEAEVIIRKAHSASPFHSYLLKLDNLSGSNRFDLDWYNSSGTGSDRWGNTNIVAGTWYHIVAVKTDANIDIYLNGSLDNSGTFVAPSGTILNSDGNFSVGAASTTGSRVDGIVDDVREYNRALSAAEVSQMYTSSYAPGTSFATEEKGTAPAAYWKFDEAVDNTCSGGVNDACNAMGNTALDGAISNGTAWKTDDLCISVKCLWFDGSDDVVTVTNGNPIELDVGLAAGFTFEAWIRPNGAGEGTGGQIFYKGTNTWLRVDTLSAGKLDIEASVDLATTDATLNVSAPVTDNQWNHVALSYTDDADDEITIWVNGVSVGTSTNGVGSLVADANNLLIGGNTTNNFKGFIDEFKIYPYERSLAQIDSDYIKGASSHGSTAVLGDGDQSYLSNGLVDYLKMDESAANGCVGAANDNCDSSGNGNDGAWNGNAANTTTAKFGNATTYDGTGDFVSVADAASISMTGKLTLSAWVKPNSSIATKAIIVKDLSYRLVTDGSGNPICQIYNGSWQTAATSSVAITTGSWYHVACAYDQNTLSVFVNGVRTGTTNLTNSVDDSANALQIGHDAGATYGDYNGQIDEVRIYNSPFFPSQITSLYNWGPGPVRYWNFDEGSGISTAYDRSTNSDNGVLNSITASDWVPGKYGSALNFDESTKYVQTAFVFPTTNFSYSFWAKSSTSGVNNRPFGAADATGGLNGTDIIWGYSTSSKIYMVNRQGANVGTYDIDATPPTSISSGWHFVAASVDSSSGAKLYWDGSLIGSNSLTTSITTGSLQLRLGREANGTSFFNGQMDDVRVYNYVRSPSQMLEDMNSAHPMGGSPVGSQTVYWKFDEQQGTSANNNNSTSDTGTISNALWKTNSVCKINGCLLFDGTGDVVTIATASDADVDFNGSQPFSMGAWVYPTSVQGSTTTKAAIIAKYDATTPTRGYRLYLENDDTDSTGNFEIEIYDESTDQVITASSTVDGVTANTWYHVFFTFNGGVAGAAGDLKLYVNGTQFSNSANASFLGLEDVTADFTVGEYDATDVAAADIGFTGYIDDVQIYSGLLTSDQVNVVKNANSSVNYGTGQVEATQLTDGSGNPPVAYWNFDENKDDTCSGGSNDACDRSGNGNDGAKTNMVAGNWIPGKVGQALQFDGSDDYVQVTNNSVFNITDNTLTLEAWVKRGTTSTTGPIIEHGTGAVGGYTLSIGVSPCTTNQIKITKYAVADICINSFPADTNWHHLVEVGNASGMVVYVDGSSVGTSVNTSNWVTSSDNLQIGGHTTTTTGYFNGSIDDVKIYDYGRTQAQVAYDYNRGGPVGWWKFDECQGTVLNDSSGNSYTGTITIGATGTYTTPGTCGSGTSTQAWNGGTTGKRNYSLALDGTDDYASITDTANIRFDTATQDYSLFAWVKRAASGAEMDVISKEDADNDGWRLEFTSSDTVRCSVNSIDVDSTSTITDTNWHFIGCTITRAGNGQVYIDGKANGTATAISSTAMATTANLIIGARSYTIANYFNGQIDDLRIYNYALSASQIRNVMNNNSGARYGPSTGTP